MSQDQESSQRCCFIDVQYIRERNQYQNISLQIQKYVLVAGLDNPVAKTTFTFLPKVIDSKKVEVYQVRTQSDYDDFNRRGTLVVRRYSEFQTLRKVLVSIGANPLRLSWTKWIPGWVSRWEELNDWVEHLGKLKFNEACLKELKRFCEDESPYHSDKMLTDIWFIDRLLNKT